MTNMRFIDRSFEAGRDLLPAQWSTLIWDFDGTVANTAEDVWDSLKWALEQFDLLLDEEFYYHNENLALGLEEILENTNPGRQRPNKEDFSQLVAFHYREISLHEKTHLYLDLDDLLAKLREKGITHWVATCKPLKALLSVLTNKGWMDLFDGLMCPDSIEGILLSKADMIKKIIENNSGSISSYCMIGDSASDIYAAKECGIASIGVCYGDGNTRMLLSAQPDYVANNPQDLKNLLLKGTLC